MSFLRLVLLHTEPISLILYRGDFVEMGSARDNVIVVEYTEICGSSLVPEFLGADLSRDTACTL
jgi:hypothetical protein